MKALILVLSVVVSIAAQARSLAPGVVTADLNIVKSETGIFGNEIVGGNVTVDYFKKEVTLSLQPAWSCPDGAACALVMPQPIEFTAPIVDFEAGMCDAVIVRAEYNDMPVDGLAVEIKVTDSSDINCLPLIAIPATQVEISISFYNRIEGTLVSDKATLAGDELQ